MTAPLPLPLSMSVPNPTVGELREIVERHGGGRLSRLGGDVLKALGPVRTGTGRQCSLCVRDVTTIWLYKQGCLNYVAATGASSAYPDLLLSERLPPEDGLEEHVSDLDDWCQYLNDLAWSTASARTTSCLPLGTLSFRTADRYWKQRLYKDMLALHAYRGVVSEPIVPDICSLLEVVYNGLGPGSRNLYLSAVVALTMAACGGWPSRDAFVDFAAYLSETRAMVVALP